MPTFTYTARDNQGQQTSGTVEADSNSRAVDHLREQGLWVTDLKESGARRTAASRPPSGPRTEDSLGQRIVAPVSARDLSVMYRQLHTMLNAGVPFFQSLEMLCQSNQTLNSALREVIVQIARQVLAGGRLSETMARFPRVFDRMQVRMVEAGESGGFLVDVFKRLSEYLEREHLIRSEVKRKTLYPKIVIAVLLLVLPVSFPMTLAGYLHDMTWLLLGIVGVGVPLWLGIRLYATSQRGKERLDQMQLAIPVIGNVIRKMAAARFARTLAATYGAGVPIASALQMSGEACGNYLLEQKTARMVPRLERGIPMSQCLAETGFFPPMFLGMVSTGESTGNLDGMLDKAAEFYEEEAAHATQQLVVTLGVVALLFVAILVGWKVIRFWQSIYSGVAGVGGE